MAVAEPLAGTVKAGEPQESAAPAAGADPPPPDSRASHHSGPAAERWLYADTPVGPGDADALSFGAYADALALLMDSAETNTPLTIAIDGPWGSGKTSLAKMTQARLPIGSDWNAPHVICWFDAWANDDAPNLGAAFAAAVAKAANKERHWWVRLVMPLPSAMLSPEQRWRRRLCYGVLAVALAAVAVFWPTGGSLLTPLLHPGAAVSDLGKGTAAIRLAWPLLAVAVILVAQRLAPSIQGVARWIDDPRSEAALGAMVDASRQLGRLIEAALRGKRRLMIFVDNLERCRPPRALEVCEVVSQLIGHPEVVTVLIGDMDTVAMSAEIKYADLERAGPGRNRVRGTAGGEAMGAYGRAYLEKLIQIQLRLPPPLNQNLRKMLVPAGKEPQAVPQDASEPKPGFLVAVADKIAARLGLQGRLLTGPVAAMLIAAVATAATIGTDFAALAGLVAAVTSAAGQRVFEASAESRRKETRKEIDDVVLEVLERTEAKSSRGLSREPDVERELAKRFGSVDGWEIRRRMRQLIVSPYTCLRKELDEGVIEALPPSPRGAKRMFNHAHLLLDIGVGRNLFDRQPKLQAGQFAVWVALTERWPSVAAAITGDPSLMGTLEAKARRAAPNFGPDQVKQIRNETGIAGLDPDLLAYLNSVESLVPVIGVLVNFYPDQNDGRVDGEAWWTAGC